MFLPLACPVAAHKDGHEVIPPGVKLLACHRACRLIGREAAHLVDAVRSDNAGYPGIEPFQLSTHATRNRHE